ncbi:LysR family transcriptional regulator [Vibrio coralliirubri]|uniref:LysR family transcriptional regulator n=1 Tax=Vibrio coralliirubri TaxID=1516159 RepID=UPI0006321A4E|nr:LysR family transcriptional regulator [Vibrio coralliirubri]CDT55939.1 Transcriptional regulators, LysR family [Vibrio coralliirubri]
MNKLYRYFLMVAHTGSIKGAAEKLNISQPSLTAAIKKLESDIGVAIFIRKSKGVELTEYGVLFREFAQEQQEKHLSLMHRFTDMQQRQLGKLKLGTGEAWWEQFVCKAVEEYKQQEQMGSLHLEFGNNLSLMHHLVQGDIDLFVGHEIYGLHERCKVTFYPLFQDKEAVFVRNGHPLLTKKYLDFSLLRRDMLDYPILQVTPDHSRHNSVLSDHVNSQSGGRDAEVVGRDVYDVDSLFASLDMLRMSDAVMPYSHKMCDWMKKRGFETLLIDDSKRGNVGLYAKQGADDLKIKTFIEILQKANFD